MARTHTGPTLVRFYQLASLPFANALTGIVGKAWQTGLKIGILAANPEQAQWVNDLLWRHPRESFLPHGLWNGPEPEHQPVLISIQPEDINGATLLVLASPETVEKPDRFDMVVDFAPTQDPAALSASRERYRRYRDLGCKLEYWTQDSQGKWEKP